MSEVTLIKGGTVVTVDANDRVRQADVLIRKGRIERIIERIPSPESNVQQPNLQGEDQLRESDPDIEILDASHCAVLPGFVQTHIHLCQTIMRGAADDLRLIDWLKKRVWPMEAAHTAESIRASAQLGVAELIKGGTTCALTMETVRHTEEVLRVVEESGFRATVGKCMMDKGDDLPRELREDTRKSIDESLDLMKEWNGKGEGRVRCCFAPR